MALSGALCLYSLPVAEYPEITPPTVRVAANYPGADAEVVANSVAMPLEDEINGVDDLLYYSSTCGNDGSYFCMVTFVSGADPDMALVNLQNAVKRAESRLPAEVVRNTINVDKRNDDILATYTFITDGRNLDIQELSDYVENAVADAVSRLDGVSSAEVFASKKYAMRIWLDPVRMAGIGLSVSDVVLAVEAQNVQAAAGSVGSEYSNRRLNFKLNVEGRLSTPEEFENIVVRADPATGSVVRLGDVAKVEVGAKSYAGRTWFNGLEAVDFSVYKAPEANAVAVAARVKEELAAWAQRLPDGVSCEIANDAVGFIQVFMREIQSTLVMALALVVIITWLFLQDWRATLVPAIAIPVSLLGTFAFMRAFGFTINILTMFGLILVIGSLVDDAIVVVENAQSLMVREKLSAKEATIKSMDQITGAVAATTLVTLACYAPLGFIGGMVGKMYLQFAFAMCVALGLSGVVALTLSPVLCAAFLRPPRGKALFRPVNWLIEGGRRKYLFLVRQLLRSTPACCLLFAGCVAAAFFFARRVPGTFLPDEDRGVAAMNIELPMAATLDRTNAVCDEIYRKTKDIPGVRSVMLTSGNSFMSGKGENCAQGIFRLADWDERKTPELGIAAIIEELQARTADVLAAKITCFTQPAISGLGRVGGVSFQLCDIVGASPEELSDAARDVERRLSALPETSRVVNGFNAGVPQLRLDIDRRKAESLGLSVGVVFDALRSQLASYYVNDFNMRGSAYEVIVQAGAGSRSTIDDIGRLSFPGANGGMIPLGTVGNASYTVGPREITRFNKMAAANLNAQTAGKTTSMELIRIIENLELPPGYHIEWSGMSLQEKMNQGQIVMVMALAMTFAYLFLVAQYESWTIPISVMLSVACAVLGALVGLWATGTPLSVYSQLGLVMLIGLSAKNAILMVEFSKRERERGAAVEEAALNGANLRFRAVMMTAWSFLCGVLPLVFATGAGSASMRSIGVATFSGMLAATLVGIVFVPSLYAMIQRIDEKLMNN